MKYKITLSSIKPNDSALATVPFLESVESNNLLEVLARFPIMVAKLQQLEKTEEERYRLDDDIPF